LQNTLTELDAFAYIASHDLEEPLGGFTAKLIEDYTLMCSESLETTNHDALTQRMEDLIESLLHFLVWDRWDLSMQR